MSPLACTEEKIRCDAEALQSSRSGARIPVQAAIR
jgi:hypothetical protein